MGPNALLCFFCYYGARRQEHQVRAKWKAQSTVENQKDLLQTQEQAMITILNRFCDRLIQLGPDLVILAEDGRLAARC